jgi:hypothetical protein
MAYRSGTVKQPASAPRIVIPVDPAQIAVDYIVQNVHHLSFESARTQAKLVWQGVAQDNLSDGGRVLVRIHELLAAIHPDLSLLVGEHTNQLEMSRKHIIFSSRINEDMSVRALLTRHIDHLYHLTMSQAASIPDWVIIRYHPPKKHVPLNVRMVNDEILDLRGFWYELRPVGHTDTIYDIDFIMSNETVLRYVTSERRAEMVKRALWVHLRRLTGEYAVLSYLRYLCLWPAQSMEYGIGARQGRARTMHHLADDLRWVLPDFLHCESCHFTQRNVELADAMEITTCSTTREIPGCLCRDCCQELRRWMSSDGEIIRPGSPNPKVVSQRHRELWSSGDDHWMRYLPNAHPERPIIRQQSCADLDGTPLADLETGRKPEAAIQRSYSTGL